MMADEIGASVEQTLSENPQWTLSEESPAPQMAQTPAPAEAPGSSFTQIDPATLDPDNQTRYKQMQADYTRKLQEVAEQRRAQAALQEQIDSYWQNPAGAQGEAPTYPEPAAMDGYETADPLVTQIVSRVTHLESRLQQEEKARQVQQIQHQMDRLERELKRPLNQQEIERTAPVLRENPKLPVEDAYWVAHRKERETWLMQQGREEALKTLAGARNAPAPPSALAGRSGPPAAPSNVRGDIMAALDQFGIK